MDSCTQWDENADAWRDLGVYLGDRLAVYNFLYYDGFYRSIDGEMLDVLDIGVGTESYLNYESVNVVALDVSSKMLAYNRCEDRVQASAADLPFPNDSFDRALSTFMMRYLSVEEQADAIGEMMRIVKPGGKIYVIDYRRIGSDIEQAPFVPVDIVSRLVVQRGKYAMGTIGIVSIGGAADYNVHALRISV